jgi:hypothetical protein
MPHQAVLPETELKCGHPSFVTSLLEFMYDPLYPPQFRADILRAKYNCKYDTTATNLAVPRVDTNHTPTDGRPNNLYDDIAAAADAGGYDGEGLVSDGDFQDKDYSCFPLPDPSIDWSVNKVPGADKYLDRHTKNYYESLGTGSLADVHMNDEEKYRPENAHGYAQKFLVGAFLIMWMRWMTYFNDVSACDDEANTEGQAAPVPPKALHAYVQGKPGTGKTYVINTLRNCIIQISGSMDRVLTVAPTGCAASLIHGKTTCRGLKVPTGKKLSK